MQHYITELSKYFITFFLILYTLEGLSVFFFDKEDTRSGIYIRQGIYLFLFQFCSYLTLCLETGQIEYLFFYAFLQIVIFSTMILYHMIYPTINRLILNNMCMLLSIGFIILTRLKLEKAIKQLVIVAISLTIAIAIPQLIKKFPILKELRWIYAGAGLVALSIVLILGQVTNGSKISFTLVGVTIQPSEFVKIIFVFFIASMLYQETTIKTILISGIIAALHVFILVASKDLGSALLFFAAYLFVLFIASKNYILLFLGLLTGSGAAVFAYKIFRHVQVRVQAWRDPWSVIDKEGYQITQSLFAIGSGNWFGLGLHQGTPGDIPYVESDFIFSAISEEMGVIVSICLVLICLSCFFMFMKIANQLKDKFYQLLAVGIAVVYILQVFLTIGGGIKFIPLTGVTLPLVSYGGSSILTTLIGFSIMQGLFMIRQDEGCNLDNEQTRKKSKIRTESTIKKESKVRME